jgi:Na+-translocating ferredoxin:NAD+ oxidoreductase RnfC subunit
VVGAGGAGFPTAAKLKCAPEYVIVKCVECEPLIQVDQQLAARSAAEMITMLGELVRFLGAQKGIFALKEKYAAAVKAVQKALSSAKNPALELRALPSIYPMGDEQVLVYETIGRIVPEGGIPLNVGAVVVNAETLLNVFEALQGKPVTEKWVTVAGAVRKPATFKVPLGVTMRSLIEAAGGATVDAPVLLDGGPMMGRLERDLDAPVTKTCKAILALPTDHPVIVSKVTPMERMLKLACAACCHCSMCSEVCPRSLLGHKLYPDKLMRLASYNSTCEKDAGAASAWLCCECRLCEYACIMGLQPWSLNHELKIKLREGGVKNPYKNAPVATNEFRQYRRYPTDKLVRQLGLADYYHVAAPVAEWKGDAASVTLPLRQHFGAPAAPVVKAGDAVKKGGLIADMAEGALGACIHASIDGVVETVSDREIRIKRSGI